MKAILIAAAVILVATVSTAQTADPKIEVGASLVSGTIGTGDNDTSSFGVPSGGFGLLQPAVYASYFVSPFFAIEPQLGFIWASSGGFSQHILNFTVQVDYFVTGATANSPYVFGAVGVLDMSGSTTNPKSAGGGVGYRLLLGDRLTFRVDGRGTHFTDGGGNTFALMLTIGGVVR